MAERRRPARALYLGATLIAPLVLAGLAAPLIAPFDPDVQIDRRGGGELPPLSQRWLIEHDGGLWLVRDLRRGDGELTFERLGRELKLPADGTRVVGRRLFVLGTDKFSRDVFSRLVYGARVTFLVAGCSIVLMMAIGVVVGAVAALGGRVADAILMRVVDGLLAFPWIFLLIALVAIWRAAGLWSLVLVIGMSGWMPISRLARAEIQSLATRDFVLAARALGAGPVRIFFRHLLPHAATPLLVQAALGIAGVVGVEAALSFLGLGVPPPRASWGNMIQDGRGGMLDAWWVATFPALALVTSVIALNLIADGLRDRLDPRRHG